jgi:hypothetical protein
LIKEIFFSAYVLTRGTSSVDFFMNMGYIIAGRWEIFPYLLDTVRYPVSFLQKQENGSRLLRDAGKN